MHIGITSVPRQLVFRWLFLITIIALELIALTASFELPPLFTPPFLPNDDSLVAWLFYYSKEIWKLGLWIFCACFLIFSPKLKVILGALQEQSQNYPWLHWFTFHTIALTAFLVLTVLMFERPINPEHLSIPWYSGWLVLASTTLLFWLLAVAPGRFWVHLIRQEHMSLFIGSLLGIGAWMLVQMFIRQEAPLGQQAFWDALAIPTLKLVHTLLSWVYQDLVYEPESFLLGTPAFQVEISYACSGIEGISLITLFLAIYLWLFRKDLRFPEVFWLFPLGIILIWLANAVRIAMLIAIGTFYSPEVALNGFHAQAGWIAFTLIALGAIALSNRLQFFTITHQPNFPIASHNKPLASALLVPLLVLMAVSMLTSASSSGFEWLYPLRVVALVISFYYFRKSYKCLSWKWTWRAPVIGTAVFVIWILLEPTIDSNTPDLAQGLSDLTAFSATVWLIFRVLGSVIAVPLAEELAFRGYLMRKLIAKDFENIPLGQFTWLSFVVTSVLFGLLHERWLAGTLAGMGYALALYQRRELGDAVVAHMTTNLLIAIFVLTQAKWSLWS